MRAGDERIELPPKVLETPIIPFDQSPMNLYVNSFYCCNYTYKSNDCQGYYAIIIKIFEKKVIIRAEMEGFEPSHRLPGLPHFECGPFSHLGTSPDFRLQDCHKSCKTSEQLGYISELSLII